MFVIFLFKQKTAYDMRISDWSSGVCSSDLERKGRKRATAISTLGLPWWSLDFFLHRAVRDALGDLNANEALYLALFKGRMRIPLNQADAVIDLIGMECARACTCLPNYRNRFCT